VVQHCRADALNHRIFFCNLINCDKCARDINQDDMITAAKADDNVQNFITGKTVRKVIAIPGKFVNIVVS